MGASGSRVLGLVFMGVGSRIALMPGDVPPYTNSP